MHLAECIRISFRAVASCGDKDCRLRRQNQCQKRPTIGAKETYCMQTFESMPPASVGRVMGTLTPPDSQRGAYADKTSVKRDLL
jgi:hypothetical protein